VGRKSKLFDAFKVPLTCEAVLRLNYRNKDKVRFIGSRTERIQHVVPQRRTRRYRKAPRGKALLNINTRPFVHSVEIDPLTIIFILFQIFACTSCQIRRNPSADR
jgi:hypothetical protein